MDTPEPTLDRHTLLNVTVFVEAFLLLAATIWSSVEHVQLLPAFKLDWQQFFLAAGSGLILASSGLLTIWLGKSLPFFSNLREITLAEIAPLFTALKPLDLLTIAAISGFCEEVLFRGVMQDQLGLWPTSIIFGLFHCPNPRFISYGLWVTTAGVLLGLLFQHTHSLWVCILTHCLSNYITLLALHFLKPKLS